MIKFGRNFRVTIDPKDGKPPIIVTMPFTIRFWVKRMALSDMNTLSLDIYNLSEANRARIYQDNWQYGLDPAINTDTAPGRNVTFELGYSNLYRVFSGVIQEASSAREGVDLVTRIEAWDNKYDIAATQTFQTLESGQSIASILSFLIGQFPTLKPGAVGNYPDKLSRAVVLNGSTWDLLKKYSNDQVYIDNGKVYVLQDAEVIGPKIYTVNDGTGLLETPRRREGTLTATMLLESGIDMFTRVNLESSVNKIYNGQYKVIGVCHEGVVSAAVNGPARSTLTLLAPGKFKNFVEVKAQ